ncbi:hypothetical protein SAMD00019534_124920 [Acytostelium subglobosum LB1]|uniref:hypothetical protein n=1 Tax=Acytostelium subglobosum LB1 TaxID=1410327 RepID=UPI0006449A39|nr:hypothetical protein SAMD00019534_124920 [Acytostelium subglobosum LB1]GAM29316.1 hypothetical protein SAMD00019534_124920 [Acytostelium subglobosum LB1]|eukprot:XP_012747743.1 hypothetical protein SAMD00019534_124920 [Acytostelium subglobosum LB1]
MAPQKKRNKKNTSNLKVNGNNSSDLLNTSLGGGTDDECSSPTSSSPSLDTSSNMDHVVDVAVPNTVTDTIEVEPDEITSSPEVIEQPLIEVTHQQEQHQQPTVQDGDNSVLLEKMYSMLIGLTDNVTDIKERVTCIQSNGVQTTSPSSVETRMLRSDSITSNGGDFDPTDWKSMYLAVSQQYMMEQKKVEDLEIQLKEVGHENILLTERVKALENHVESEKKKLHKTFGTIRSSAKKLTVKMGRGNVDVSDILEEMRRDIDNTSSGVLDQKVLNADALLTKLNSFPSSASSTSLLQQQQQQQQLQQQHQQPVQTSTDTDSIISDVTTTDDISLVEESATLPVTDTKTTNLEQQQTDITTAVDIAANTSDESKQDNNNDFTGTDLKKLIKVQACAKRWYARQQFKRLKKKRLAVQELFETESTYVSHLSNLLKIFVSPLKMKSQNGEAIIGLNDIERIFSTANIIFKSNSIFLNQMEDMYRNFSKWSELGGRMLEQLPLFESYIEYIINFESAQTSLKKAMTSSNFASFVKTAESNAQLGDLDLHDLLIMPVQRIPRYIMLIHQIKKFTPLSHPDYLPLTLAEDAFKKFADGINDRKGMRIKVLQFEEKIIGYKEDLTAKSRYLIRDGPLRYKKTTEHVFLFNDMLMVCHPQVKKTKTKLGSISVSSSLATTSSSTSLSLGAKYQDNSIGGGNSPTLSPTPSSPTHEDGYTTTYKFITRVMLDSRVKIVQDGVDPKFLTIIPDIYSLELAASSNEERQLWVKDLITLVTIFNNNLINNPSTGHALVPHNN